MKKLWDLEKKVLSNLELEGQGRGIIMRVTRLLLLGPFYTIQTKRDQTFCTRVYFMHWKWPYIGEYGCLHISKIKMVLNITTIISRNLSYDGCTFQKAGDRKRKSGRHFRLQGRTERQRSIFGPGPHIWCLQASNFQSTLDPWRTEKVSTLCLIILLPSVKSCEVKWT